MQSICRLAGPTNAAEQNIEPHIGLTHPHPSAQPEGGLRIANPEAKTGDLKQ